MAEIADLNANDANNIGRFPEGQLIPTFNDGGRALEGILARADRDRSGYNLTTGDGAAYAITTFAAYPALTSGMWFLVKFNLANTGACTMQLNALTAKPLRKRNNAALVVGDIYGGDLGFVAYNSSNDTFQVFLSL